MPSLVSIPLLGYREYDAQVYATTRRRLLNSQTNSYYFQGKEFKVRPRIHAQQYLCTNTHGPIRLLKLLYDCVAHRC